MSLKQDILDEWQMIRKKAITEIPDHVDFFNRIDRCFISQLSLIEQEVRKCVPNFHYHKRTEQEPTQDESAYNDGHNICRQQTLDNINKLFE